MAGGGLFRGVTMSRAEALAQNGFRVTGNDRTLRASEYLHSHGKISPRVLLFLPKCMYNWEKEGRFGRKGDV